MEYIKKEDIKVGWYIGFCRNANLAFWDGKEFMHIRNKFFYRWDTIEHFDDVKEKKLDGFVPLKKLEYEEPDYKVIEKVKQEIGY